MSVRVAYLGPFVNRYLQATFPDLTEADLKASPGMGGFGLVETVLERMRSGRPTVLVTLDDRLKGGYIKRTNGVVSFYSCPRRPHGALLDWYRAERHFIGAAIRESRPDILHVHWTGDYAVAALTADFGVPVLVTARDHPLDVLRLLGPRYLPRFAVAMWVIRRAAYMTTVSPHVYRFLAKLGKSRLWLVENAASEALLNEGQQRRHAQSRSRHSIVSATIWSRLKNPKAALRAFRVLRDRRDDVELHLCGAGMERDGPAERWARPLGLERDVVFEGNLTHDEVIDLLRGASAYLHTSRTEAFNTAITEAMALGVPVVGGFRAGGVPYQVDYGRAGLLVDLENRAAVADAVEGLIECEPLRKRLQEAAWSRVRQLCRPSVVLDAYEVIYETLVTERRCPEGPLKSAAPR